MRFPIEVIFYLMTVVVLPVGALLASSRKEVPMEVRYLLAFTAWLPVLVFTHGLMWSGWFWLCFGASLLIVVVAFARAKNLLWLVRIPSVLLVLSGWLLVDWLSFSGSAGLWTVRTLVLLGAVIAIFHYGHRPTKGTFITCLASIVILAVVGLFMGAFTSGNTAKNTAAFTWSPDKSMSDSLKVSFDASVSRDSEGIVANAASAALIESDKVELTWDFGDKQTGTGIKPDHVYAKPGDFEVVLTLSEKGRPNATKSETVTVAKDTSQQGDGTLENPRPVALEDVGPNACLSGKNILDTLRAKKPGGATFQLASFSTSAKVGEIATLENQEVSRISDNARMPCIKALAASVHVKPEAFSGYVMSHWDLIVVPKGGKVVQNSYFADDGSIVWWDVQQFPEGELIWVDKKTGEPQMKFVCVNRLRKAVVPKTQASPTPSKTKPTTTTHSPSPKPSEKTPTHSSSPKPSKSPTPSKTPKTAPSLNITELNDVDAGGTSGNFCATAHLPGSDSGTLTFGSVYGDFSPNDGLGTRTRTFDSVNDGDRLCVTYVAPNEVPKNNDGKDTITVNLLDTSTGLSAPLDPKLGINPQSFPINPPPVTSRG